MLYLISDLHLGDGGPRDNFKGREVDFLNFLDYIGDNELLILGDLFEGWQFNIGTPLIYNTTILDRLTEKRTTYIIGNHDWPLWDLIRGKQLTHPLLQNVELSVDRVIGQRRFHFSHGHTYDSANACANPGFGEILAIIAGIYEDEVGSPKLSSGQYIEEVLVKYAERFVKYWNYFIHFLTPLPAINKKIHLNAIQSGSRFGQNLANIYKFKQDNSIDVMVAGHLHRLGLYEDWYCNTGSWVERWNEFVSIDDNGSIKLYRWWLNKPVELAPGEINLPFRV